jgi:hypothetical protein
MVRSSRPAPSGQTTVRFPVEVHAELLEIGDYLGVDLNATINMMINHARPLFLKQAAKLAEERVLARRHLDQAVVQADHPLVREMVQLALPLPEERRLEAIADHGLMHHPSNNPPLPSLVQKALEIVQDEERRRLVEKALAERTTFLLGRIGDAAAKKTGEQIASKADAEEPGKRARRGGSNQYWTAPAVEQKRF